MWSYTLRRVLAALPTMLVVITVCYLLLHVTPGGPFDSERKVSAAVLANLQAKYHLDMPLWQQYLLYLKSLLQGDLGASFRYADWSVNDLVANALPVSAVIGGGSLLLSVVIGVAVGIVAALRQNSAVDYGVMLIGNVGSAVPSFVLGPVLIIVFAILLQWLPAGGWNNFEPRFMILPMVLLTFINVSIIGRVMRGSLIEVLHSNYIRTARAKGLSRASIILKHALRNAAMPVVSIAAVQLGFMLGGSVVIESVFALPGVGYLAWESITKNDFPVVQAVVLFLAIIYIALTLLADMMNALLDPRLRG